MIDESTATQLASAVPEASGEIKLIGVDATTGLWAWLGSARFVRRLISFFRPATARTLTAADSYCMISSSGMSGPNFGDPTTFIDLTLPASVVGVFYRLYFARDRVGFKVIPPTGVDLVVDYPVGSSVISAGTSKWVKISATKRSYVEIVCITSTQWFVQGTYTYTVQP